VPWQLPVTGPDSPTTLPDPVTFVTGVTDSQLMKRAERVAVKPAMASWASAVSAAAPSSG
jgi:hypothetical protein